MGIPVSETGFELFYLFFYAFSWQGLNNNIKDNYNDCNNALIMPMCKLSKTCHVS